MSATKQRTLQIVRDHLAQPPAATTSDALTRALAVDTLHGDLARRLVNRVGGLAELQSLDTAPHGDEPLDWEAVTDQDRAFVSEVVSLLDGVCDTWLDVEYRTILRRLLARVLRTDPSPIRRSSRPARIAAGLTRAVLEANAEIGRHASRRSGHWAFRAGDVAAWFGAGDGADTARTLVKAAGFDRRPLDERIWPQSIDLPSPDLLHSGQRSRLIEERERVIELFVEEEQRRAGRRPMVTLADGSIQLRGCAAEVAFVAKADATIGQVVMLAMAPLVPEPELEVYGVTVPEAHRLVHLLLQALEQPGHFLSPSPRGEWS